MNNSQSFVLCIIGSLYFLLICLTCRLLLLCKKYLTEDQREQAAFRQKPRPKAPATNEVLGLAMTNDSSTSDWSDEISRIDKEQKNGDGFKKPDVFTIA